LELDTSKIVDYLCSAHYTLLVYLLVSHSVNKILIFMVYISGLASVLLLSMLRKTYESMFIRGNLLLIGITTFIACTMIPDYAIVTRWLPVILQEIGSFQASRSSEAGVQTINVATVFGLLYLLLNVVYITL